MNVRLHLSFPSELVSRPVIYEVVKRYDVIPNIRRANVETDTGWVILELSGASDSVRDAVAYFEEAGVIVSRMEGDVIA
jgi:hypothetical protein